MDPLCLRKLYFPVIRLPLITLWEVKFSAIWSKSLPYDF